MVSVKPFGKGELITVSDENITVEFIPVGAAVRSILVPDKNGNMTSVVEYDADNEITEKTEFDGYQVIYLAAYAE